MSKIQARTGISLPDVYDVKGSVASVEELEAKDVQLMHEMGGTIFSERLGVTIRRLGSGAIAASSDFDVFFTNNPDSIMRVLGVVVTVSANRLANCTVSIRRPEQDTEFPIFNWDGSVDTQVVSRFVISGSVTDAILLRPLVPVGAFQTMMLGVNQFDNSPDIAFRGTTTAFGAGTLTAQMFIYLAFARTAGVSSYGLPIPGW